MRLFNPITHQARCKTKTMPSEIGFPMTLTSGAFLNQNPINKPARNNKRILKAAVIHFLHPMEKDNWNITRWHKTLSASAISKKNANCQKLRAHKNFLTTKIWKETHLREVFYGTLIFQQSSMICIGCHVGGHTLALQHGGQNYFLLISC